MSMPSFFTLTRIQSSVRPTMMVQTGDISLTGLPSAERRLRPRSMASATAMACGTVKQTVALIDTPW